MKRHQVVTIVKQFVFLSLCFASGSVAASQQPGEFRPSGAKDNKAGSGGPNMPEVTIDVRVKLVETKQFVPGLRSSNFRVYEDGVQQKIESFNEGIPAEYKLTYPPNPGQNGNQRKIRVEQIRVELVDDEGRPLRMQDALKQDEGHRLLKYLIT